MASRGSGLDKAGSAGSPAVICSDAKLGPCSILVLSGWCGLVAGLLETGIVVIHKRYLDINHFYGKSMHFVWLVPLADFLLFVVLGLVLSLVIRCGSWGRRTAPRVLATLALLPPFLAAFPRIFGAALFLLTMGMATWLVPAAERRSVGLARVVRLTFPVAAGLFTILAASCWGAGKVKEWREAAQPFPSSSSPNVLLIVLDTVSAGHLSLHGYHRPTSPTIDQLASRGICFKQAQVTASWTLPSHASIFTGRWPHELSAGWFTPLDTAFPTVAEHLGARGYATAGFVANTAYCAIDSGLARGFTTYRDCIFPEFTVLYLTALASRMVDGFQGVESIFTDVTDNPVLRSPADRIWRLFGQGRKDAAMVNREVIDWLSSRPQRERPFFAFLNYYDAHAPYELPATGLHQFGGVPRNDRQAAIIRDWGEKLRRRPSPRQIAFACAAYDDCVAHLDKQLGALIDDLERRGVLGRTWVIITADHGESFGEHPGVFAHGTTLYQTESHVPLVIIPPGGVASPKVITEPVSLRDLAATIVNVSGLKTGSAFPGDSLARFWDASSDRSGPSPVLSELAPETSPYSHSPRSDHRPWPVATLIEGDWSYTRRDGDLLELLFNLREDAGELHNRVDDPAVRPMLERMRQTIRHLTAGPLTPDRFNP